MCFYGANISNARAAVIIMAVITLVCAILQIVSASRAFGSDYFVFAQQSAFLGAQSAALGVILIVGGIFALIGAAKNKLSFISLFFVLILFCTIWSIGMVAYLFSVSVAFEIKEQIPTDIQAVYKLAIEKLCSQECPCGFEGSRVTGITTVTGGPTRFQDCPADTVYLSQYDRGAIFFRHLELDYQCSGFGTNATPTKNLFYFYDVNKTPTRGNDCLVHYQRLQSVSFGSFAQFALFVALAGFAMLVAMCIIGRDLNRQKIFYVNKDQQKSIGGQKQNMIQVRER